MKTLAEIRAALVELIETTDGHAWAYVDRDPGDGAYHATQLKARAWGSHG